MASWVAETRDEAERNLASLPALTGQEEDWRFTKPASLGMDGAPLDAPGPSGSPRVGDEAGRAAWLVLDDGRPAAPNVVDLPDGVIVAELSDALTAHEDLVRAHLNSLVGIDSHAGALNAARWDGGLFVYVPRGVHVERPIEAVLTATGAEGRIYGRTLVVLEEGAKATVIDRYVSPDLGGTVQASTVAELVVAQGAELEHMTSVSWGSGVHHHATITAAAGRDSKVRSVVVTLGGDVVRVEPTLRVVGPGADARALGLFFASDDQHFEHRVVSVHEAPDSYSNLLYKGALKDTSRTVFYGNLIVPPGAPHTDAYQTNRNLILNDGASAETIPFLEIETAEVKCSHAGAVGRVDDEHLFYLRSRGVPEVEAKQLIVLGFLQEVLEMVALEELREELHDAIAAKLTPKVAAS